MDVQQKAEEIAAVFEDGFQFADVYMVIRLGMEFAELFDDLTGSEKKDIAVTLINKVIDLVNIPWIPDVLVDPFLKMLVPAAIELVIDTSKGEVSVNDV